MPQTAFWQNLLKFPMLQTMKFVWPNQKFILNFKFKKNSSVSVFETWRPAAVSKLKILVHIASCFYLFSISIINGDVSFL